MSIVSLIILFLVAAIVIYIRNNSGKKRDTPVRNSDNLTPEQPVYSAEYGENESDDDIEGDPLFKKALDKLTSVVMPDKYGDFNDAKKIGKTIEKSMKKFRDISVRELKNMSDSSMYFTPL